MSRRGTDKLIKSLKQTADLQFKQFKRHHGQTVMDVLEFPIKLIFSPFTFAFDVAGSAQRGFGIPELISKISYSAIFVVATLGTYDIALELGKKVLCQRECRTCCGWQAMQCTMCKGLGKVQYQVKNYTLRSGEKATAENIADAVMDNRAELVHLPSTLDLQVPLPSKECPSCDGTGVMKCPECKGKLQVRISADNIMEPPWVAQNILRKMEYPYEHIVDSMKDPSIAAFWLFTMPEMVGGFKYDDEVKQKIWWQYKDNMRYDQLRDVVAKRKPGWEYLQEALISIDPARAREDPVIVRNVPFYKAKKALEAEALKLNPPPRPQNWGVSAFLCFFFIRSFWKLSVYKHNQRITRVKPQPGLDQEPKQLRKKSLHNLDLIPIRISHGCCHYSRCLVGAFSMSSLVPFSSSSGIWNKRKQDSWALPLESSV